MSLGVVPNLFRVILAGKSSIRFLIGSIISLSFSVTVVLCGLGLMDGFESTLKKALASSNGDIKITHRSGYFFDSPRIKKKIYGLGTHTAILESQGMALIEGDSKGILARGIDPDTFSDITALPVENLAGGILIGKELAKLWGLKIGDSLLIAFPTQDKSSQGRAKVVEFIIDGVIDHNIYEKDLRTVYMKKETLLKILSLKESTSSLVLIKLHEGQNVDTSINKLKENFEPSFTINEYWKEFEVLLEAVQIEKYSITIVLQLIVIVAMLNIAAFVIYIFEKKALDFFMLRSLGLSIHFLNIFWFLILLVIWLVSCLLSFVGVWVCNYALREMPYFEIPGDIYVLDQLQIILDQNDYLYVFGVSLVWLFLIGSIAIFKIKKKSLISSLKEGFS